MDADTLNAEQLIPLTHLSLDLEPPVMGWLPFFHERGTEIVLDDIGRPSIPRSVLGELIAERRDSEARLAAEQAAKVAAAPKIIPGGVPAVDGTPFEAMAAADGYTLPSQEFGNGRVSPREEFLDEMFREGQRREAEAAEERRLVKEAQRALDGRGK